MYLAPVGRVPSTRMMSQQEVGRLDPSTKREVQHASSSEALEKRRTMALGSVWEIGISSANLMAKSRFSARRPELERLNRTYRISALHLK